MITTTDAGAQRAKVVVLGATGCVGRDVVERLARRCDTSLTLASRGQRDLAVIEKKLPGPIRLVRVDLERWETVSRLFSIGVDVMVNCAGRYREFGMPVAREAAARGVDLIDIADEPIYLDQVRALSSVARDSGSRLVIGSGSAPQCTGALIRLGMERVKPPYHVVVAACFGVNRVGPNAVRTATEAVGGWISRGPSGREWKKGIKLDFGKPFGRMTVRHYPLPETVLLGDLEGVDRWFAGACLSSAPVNAIAAGLKAILLARQPRKSVWMEAWCRLASQGERFLAACRCGPPGIAFRVEVRGRTTTAVGHLYHPDMTALTADAVMLTYGRMRTTAMEPGVCFAHECIEPEPFLNQLGRRGAVWSLDAPAE